MTHFPALGDISRIDKLWLDRDGTTPGISRAARTAHRLQILVGSDVAGSHALQVAVMTAVNLAVKCFAAPVLVTAPDDVWTAQNLTRVSIKGTIGEAIEELGAERSVADLDSDSISILVGNAQQKRRSLRLTFDGWRVSVGPATKVPRLPENPLCSLAPLAAAAVAIGEVFASFARIAITAMRRPIAFSLWRPDLPIASPESLGILAEEAPLELSCFGLGHLGQAYLWALACLPYGDPRASTIYLCDDDAVEPPNLETGALLNSGMVGARKTRVVARWLEDRGFNTRLIERFVDSNYRRSSREPALALSGFHDNQARHWLAQAEFPLIFDSGLGGDAENFDSIAVHTWPNQRTAVDLWPVEDAQKRREREAKVRRQTENPGYHSISPDECGRVLVANKSIAVPFVGALSSAFVLAELLRTVNAGPVFHDVRLRACALSDRSLASVLRVGQAEPVSGIRLQRLVQT